ncbi:MAG: type II toxin-antitoxin system PemK/MazF family toxin [Acidimicrobiia bacterium]|nr:type II toxin-antitoxin system PemK/MazF family toxin [Acidimicrobiia bacterium]
MNPGTIWYAKPDPTVGREQTGRRPVLVVSSSDFARNIPDLVVAVPLTSRDRGLRHHISVVGDDTNLESETWALCEQVRAISRSRLDRMVGTVDRATLEAVRGVIATFLDL